MPKDLYQQMQDARRAHRHAAHVYANTKNTPANKPKYDAAVEALENAAMVYVLAAAAYGTTQSDAPPAHPTREKWEKDTNPDPKPRKR